MKRPNSTLLAATILACSLGSEALAQDRDDAHTLRGQVVDASSGEPLSESVVLLLPGTSGFLNRSGGSVYVPNGWSTTTDGAGEYRFPGLTAGHYTLLVSRIAYEPARVEVDLAPAGAQISVALVIDPIAMEPQTVLVPGSATVTAAHRADHDGDDRAEIERARQRDHLESDARIVAYHDVVDAVTLAETDLFRAFQRLPGVSTRDDYTAELWTRGAPWSHTSVRFDGVPLFNPLHGAGSISGVNVDAVGAALFHPGVRPLALGQSAAAVIDLTSRPASDAATHGRAEVSMISSRFAIDRRSDSARLGFMAAARRSHLDLVSRAIETLGGDEDARFPYDFHDLTGRLDIDLGDGSALELSGLWEQDAVRDDIPRLPEAHRARWGSAAGRVTLESRAGDLRARHTVGVSRFYARGDATFDPDPDAQSLFNLPGQPATRSSIRYLGGRGEWAPSMAPFERRWSAGYELAAYRHEYTGPAPTPYPGPTSLRRDSLSGAVEVASVWFERRWPLGERTSIETGMRLETGSDVFGLAPVRAAPRLSIRHRIGASQTYVNGGYLRSHQYAQVLAPAGIAVGPRLHANEQWLLADETLPALRSDLVTFGAERWLGGEWLVGVTAYRRAVSGFPTPAPTIGDVSPDAEFAVGENRARGLELSTRRLVGRWTGSFAYTLGSSRVDVDGVSFPAPTDRRHGLDASIIARLTDRTRVGAAMTWASGAPFTRFFPAEIACSPSDGCVLIRPARVEAPNAERTDAYASVDAVVEWTRPHERWELTLFGQIRNVFNRDNAVTYRGTVDGLDRFTSGIPFLPTIGARITF